MTGKHMPESAALMGPLYSVPVYQPICCLFFCFAWGYDNPVRLIKDEVLGERRGS